MPIPIDPTMATGGAEWQVPGISQTDGIDPSALQTDGVQGAEGTQGVGFGSSLSKAMGSLEQTQAAASESSRALATGQMDDPSQAVMAMERARLSMDFASQVRNKAVEAYQEIFRSQV